MTDNELFGNSELMDDTISRHGAIKAIKDALLSWSNMPGWRDNKIVGALDKLPSAQQWISWDSGKFPKESGTYTVTAYDGATKRVTYAKYQKRLKRWELTGARAYWRVLAWLPPLEPWEGDTP